MANRAEAKLLDLGLDYQSAVSRSQVNSDPHLVRGVAIMLTDRGARPCTS